MNPIKGEVELPAGDDVYTLRFSIDAICSLEAMTGKPFSVTATEMADPKKASMTLVRMLLAAALQERHPELSLKDVGELIIPAGGMAKVTAKVFEAFAKAFPEAEASDTARPPRGARPAGTGRASGRNGVLSA
jgi:hypothetical protein